MANEEFWTLDTLRTFSETTCDVNVCGKLVSIKKLPASVMNSYKDGNDDATYMTILKGLVKPTLTLEQIKSLPLDMYTQITKAIMEFSNVSMEDAEKN